MAELKQATIARAIAAGLKVIHGGNAVAELKLADGDAELDVRVVIHGGNAVAELKHQDAKKMFGL